MISIIKFHWKFMLHRRIIGPAVARIMRPEQESKMTTIYMAPGATVIVGPEHKGLQRMTTGVGLLAGLLAAAIRRLDAYRSGRIAAHNEAMLLQLAAVDHRVLEELRAARDRAQG